MTRPGEPSPAHKARHGDADPEPWRPADEERLEYVPKLTPKLQRMLERLRGEQPERRRRSGMLL